MAGEEMDPSCHDVPQIPQPFVWSEDAHGLYLSFLEDAFVNDLYQRYYCSFDICGCSPPSTAYTPPLSIAADECPSPAPPQPPTLPQPSQPNSKAEQKECPKRPCTNSKARSTKRKGKWLSQDAGPNNQLVFEPNIAPHENMLLFEQPGSSLHPFGNSECFVPKGPRGGSKRSCMKGVDVKFCGTDRQMTDQVVPADWEED